MGKMFLGLWVFLSSLIRIPEQLPASHLVLADTSTTKVSQTLPTLSLLPSSFPTSTYHFPSTYTVPLDTSNWVSYFDPNSRARFPFPSEWEYHLSANSSVVAFKPAHIGFLDMEGNQWCVNVALGVNDFQTELQRLPIPYNGRFELEPIHSGGLSGVHYRDQTFGVYLLNKDGKALQFNYMIINGHDYSRETEQMVKSLVFLN